MYSNRVMIKRLTLLAVVLCVTLTASAQFEKGKKYISASLSGLDLSYNGLSEFNVGFEAKGGYMFDDNLMLLGILGYNHV